MSGVELETFLALASGAGRGMARSVSYEELLYPTPGFVLTANDHPPPAVPAHGATTPDQRPDQP